MKHEISLVDESQDTVVYLPEIDIDLIQPQMEKVSSDPFRRVDASGQSKKTQRLIKRLVGVEGAQSKYSDPLNIDGYGLFNVTVPPYDLDTLSTLYDECGFLHATVDARVMNTVGLGFNWKPTTKAEKRVSKSATNAEKADRIRHMHQAEQDRLELLFESFNEEETFTETMVKIWTDMLVTGNGYMEVGRTNSGKIGYIGHIPSRLMRVRKERDGYVQLANRVAIFFRNFGDSETKDPIGDDPKPNEILHFKIYSPNHTFYGIPPSVSVISAIIGDKFAKEYNIDYFENKAIPRYAIILKGVKLSESSKRELITYFKKEVKGRNHGTLVVPIPATIGSNNDADIRFEKLEAGVQEGSFDQYRKSNRDEIISAYRVPPTKVGVYDNANMAVARDADKTFKTQVVSPDQVIAEKKINRIVTEFSDLFLFFFEQLDIIDEDLRSRIHDRYLRTEVITPNEVRTQVGLPAIAGGDEVLVYPTSLKLQQGGKPAADGTGNTNAMFGTPPKSGQDNGSNATPKTDGTGQERGEAQDTQGVRERG
jgi:PBSX family phage portal protein